MPAIISWVNAADDPLAEIDASSEVSGLGARSLLTPQISDVFRTGVWSNGSIFYLTIDLGRVRDLRLFALAAPRDGHLPDADAKVRVVASVNSPGDADAMNSGLLPLDLTSGVWAYLPQAAVMARYVQFRCVAGAADTYLQLGRLWLGPALVTASSSNYGQQRGYADAGSNDRSGVSGVRFATPGAVRRQPQWSLPSMPEADKNGVEAAALAAGTTRQIFASPFAGAPSRDGVFGHFTAPPAARLTAHRRWSADISLDEDL
jgi:hypothetical protein